MDRRTTKRCLGQLKQGMLIRIFIMCALVGVLLTVGVSYASYSSSDGAEDGARVAGGLVKVEYDKTKEVDEDGNPKIDLVRPSNDGILTESFGFSVSNDSDFTSEVAIEYDINVTLQDPNTLPNGVKIKLMSEDKVLGSLSGSGNEGTLAASGVFEPGQAEKHKYTIVFEGDFDTIRPGIEAKDHVDITINAEQVD